MTPKIKPEDAIAVVCTCGSELFQEAIKLKKVSRLVALTPNDVFVPIPAMVCLKCGLELKNE